MYVCVGYPHTLLFSQAAKLIQELCYPPTKDRSTSADFLEILDDGGALAAAADCPVMGISPSLR